MAIYYPEGCTDEIFAPVCSDCPAIESAGLRSGFFIKQGFTFLDISNANEWATGIESNDIYIFPKTRGNVAIAETVSQGFGDQEESFDSLTYTIQLFDPNYKGNYGFWNTIKRSNNFKFGYRTQSQVHLSDVTALIVPKNPVVEDKKQRVLWDVMIKFTQENIVQPIDMPIGVFEKCIAVTP